MSPQSGEADRRQIRELLVHFKGKGTILLDGIGSPQPAVRALLEQLESSRTSSRTSQSGVQMMREAEEQAIQRQIADLGEDAVPQRLAVIEEGNGKLGAAAVICLLDPAEYERSRSRSGTQCAWMSLLARRSSLVDFGATSAWIEIPSERSRVMRARAAGCDPLDSLRSLGAWWSPGDPVPGTGRRRWRGP